MSSPACSRLEVWLIALAILAVSIGVSFTLAERRYGPRPHRLLAPTGQERIAFTATAEALDKLHYFKMDKGVLWLASETRVLMRERGAAASLVEVVSGEQKGRVGYVEAKLVEDGWH